MTWQDIPGYTCPRLLELYDEIAATVHNGTIVEVGVAYGRSLAYIVDRARTNRFFGVDTWDEFMGGDNLPTDVFARMQAYGTPKEAAAHEIRRALHNTYAHWVQLIQKTSVEAAKEFSDDSVDFVFLDDRHEYEALRDGIAAWLPKIKPGGVLAGHDINDHYPGVGQAVREAFGDNVDVRTNPDGWGGVWKFGGPRW
jgi:cephalosporin hydroxylase